MNIVCLGEVLVDFKATGPLAFQGYVGGSPLNVAVTAGRLGAAAGFASQISTDLFGEQILAHLQQNGVDTSLVLRSDAPSTLAFVAESEGEAHFSFLASGTADSLYDPRPRPALPHTMRFLQFGSISLLQEPAAGAISEIVESHRGAATVVFDPNVRPALIPDRQAYLERLSRWVALAHIVKVSCQDLAWLYPQTRPDEVASSWLSCGPEAVLITDGARGVTLYRRDRPPLSSAALAVETIDTVGAGDTFTGALMTALLERGLDHGNLSELDDSWHNVLRFASAAAALNCTRAGTDPPTRDELQRFGEL